MTKRIINVNWGIGSRVGNKIYLNKRLKDYPKLRRAIIEHENSHTEGFGLRDLVVDVDIKELKGMKKEYYKFVLSNPTSWIEFLPIKKYGDTILFNFPIFLMWLILGGLLCMIIVANW